MEAATERDPGRPDAAEPRRFATGEPLGWPALLAAPLKSLPRPSILEAPLTKLHGAGPKLAAAADEIGIAELGDLLRHAPHSYRDRADPVGLARQKDHISLYVNAVADGRYLVQAYVDRLGKAKVGSANVSFKRLADIDEDALLELVRRAASEG